MTTWCKAQQQKTQPEETNSSTSSSPLSGKSRGSAGRHSIAQILGWTGEKSHLMAAANSSSLDNMAVEDQPLDLSLDKSKCRASSESLSKKKSDVKNRPAVSENSEEPEETEENEEEEEDEDEEDWTGHHHQVGAQHLQMAANFSTVLQYYLTAARLWQQQQTGQQRGTAESLHDGANEAGNSITASPAGSTELGGTRRSANEPPAAKRRKKEIVVDPALMLAGDPVAVRPRKTRTTFTGKQLFELERIFEQKKYLSSNERQEVARLLSVTGSQIKIWFQNRRTKWKKQDPNTAAELAQLKSASRSQQHHHHHHQTVSSSGRKTPPPLPITDPADSSDVSSVPPSSPPGQVI